MDETAPRPRVHFVLEFNCYHEVERSWWERLGLALQLVETRAERGFASAWASQRALEDCEEPGGVARRVIGPVPWEQAEEAIEELTTVLQAAGAFVSRSVSSDD